MARRRASSGQQRAFLWRNGVMTDLNTLLPAASGWLLQVATSISDGGQIVGYGTLNGHQPGVPPHAADGPCRCALAAPYSQHDSNLPRDGIEVGKPCGVHDLRVGLERERLSRAMVPG